MNHDRYEIEDVSSAEDKINDVTEICLKAYGPTSGHMMNISWSNCEVKEDPSVVLDIIEAVLSNINLINNSEWRQMNMKQEVDSHDN